MGRGMRGEAGKGSCRGRRGNIPEKVAGRGNEDRVVVVVQVQGTMSASLEV
jgi:hypothetical protein